jgi:glycosyltransferase involved in cell wall biosynthesis
MNIGVDIKALYRGRAGIAAYIARTLDALQEIDSQNNYFLFEKRESSYRISNPLWKRVVIPSRLPGTIWLMFKIPIYFRKYSLDVFWGPEQIIPCILPFGKTPLVSTVHDVALKRCPGTMQTTNYFINMFFLGKSIRHARKVLTVSNTIKDDLCRYYPRKGEQIGSKIVVTYEGKPNWTVPAGEGRARSDHLLFVGSFEPRKNLLNLLKALLICKAEKRTVVRLRIIGPGGWKSNRVREFIDKNGLAPQVSFAGYVDETSLIKEYCSCRAIVYPSLYEGFGLPVLESLTTETPVLTSRGTAMEEIAGNCCVLFDPADPRDIAEKVLSVYGPDFNPAALLRDRKKVLDNFSWEATARQTLAVLREAGLQS